MSSQNMNTSLKIFEPMNVVVFLSLFSPIVLATSIAGSSFVFQNFKGIIYLAFLIGASLLRSGLYITRGYLPARPGERSSLAPICSAVEYSKYGNSTFSTFVFAFTMVYLFFPMFSNSAPNFWVFSVLVSYFFLDLFLKFYKKCVNGFAEVFINLLMGGVISICIVSAMMAGGSGKYLFFNEISSNKDVCYKPKNQTFKCSMYKNGELISKL